MSLLLDSYYKTFITNRFANQKNCFFWLTNLIIPFFFKIRKKFFGVLTTLLAFFCGEGILDKPQNVVSDLAKGPLLLKKYVMGRSWLSMSHSKKSVGNYKKFRLVF